METNDLNNQYRFRRRDGNEALLITVGRYSEPYFYEDEEGQLMYREDNYMEYVIIWNMSSLTKTTSSNNLVKEKRRTI